jgi:hypothetical protein
MRFAAVSATTQRSHTTRPSSRTSLTAPHGCRRAELWSGSQAAPALEHPLDEPPGDERVERTDDRVDDVVLTGVHDREDDSYRECGLRGEQPERKPVLSDHEQADNRPGGVQGGNRCDDVVASGVALQIGKAVELQVLERVLEDWLHRRDQPLLRGEPRWRGGGEEKRDVPENRDGQDAEQEVGEPSAAPERPEEKREQERRRKCDMYIAAEEELRRADVSVVEMGLEPVRRQRPQYDAIGVDLREIVDPKPNVGTAETVAP